MYAEIALLAYLIDKFFGEFSFIKLYTHPVVLMGKYISWYERKFYKDSIFIGFLLTISLLFIVALVCFFITYFISNIFILGLIASSGIAANMLYSSVKDVMLNPENIKFLVSRDTADLSASDINKAAIETYAENLSDGVIAPLFYLLAFGIMGLFVYKAINTLDSMVGYKTPKYDKFGKFSAKLDDIANYIPARITAILIATLGFSKIALLKFYSFGKHHESPNAGHPISAMALWLGVKLGGDTKYFGVVKQKPFFGFERFEILQVDIQKALSLQIRLDIFIILFLGALIWL